MYSTRFAIMTSIRMHIEDVARTQAIFPSACVYDTLGVTTVEIDFNRTEMTVADQIQLLHSFFYEMLGRGAFYIVLIAFNDHMHDRIEQCVFTRYAPRSN